MFRNCSVRSGARAFQRLRLIKEEKKLPDRNKPPSGPGSGLYRAKYEPTLIISLYLYLSQIAKCICQIAKCICLKLSGPRSGLYRAKYEPTPIISTCMGMHRKIEYQKMEHNRCALLRKVVFVIFTASVEQTSRTCGAIDDRSNP